jgi:hypothetical protein
VAFSNRTAKPGHLATGVSGVRRRRPLSPHRRLVLAVAPVDVRNGMEGLAAGCRPPFAQKPLDGAIDGFRHRTGTPLKRRCDAGQGDWFWTQRRSPG